MLGLNDGEARLRFARAANKLHRKGWPWSQIAEKLLGDSRWAQGAKKLAGVGYVAEVQLQSA